VILVREPGPLTTVQDLGRPGHAHLGVPLAGAADRPALRAANRLVGNPAGAAALETTLVGLVVEAEAHLVVAVTGAHCPVSVDGVAVAFGAAVPVPAGAVLRLGPASFGVRSYLAVRGGIDVPAVLGSRSTCTLSGLGPAALRAGDRLGVGASVAGAVGAEPLPELSDEPVLRLVPGPRDDAFVSLDPLLTSSYVVDARSDRTGVRVEGAALVRVSSSELLSEGVVPGAVQVPPDGQPIVLLANCPTTGGYPVAGVVLPEDLPHAAQARPGTRLRFRLA
jgi:biotin-dependent carboxylase-like uncharacterized protein